MPTPNVLEYQSPNSPGYKRFSTVLDDLRKRDALVKTSAWTMIFFAFPLLFIGPFILAIMFWAALFNFGHYVPFSICFLVLVLVMIPAMFWGEARQRGGLFAGANLDVSPGGLDGGSLSPMPMIAMGELGTLVGFATNPRLAASGFVEIFLFGPRLALDGLTKLRRAGQLRQVKLERAAEAVMDLAKFDRGVAPQALLRKSESMAALVPVLCLLVFHDWIGVSKRGDNVWLLSDARNRLRA